MKPWMKWTLTGLIVCGVGLVATFDAVRAEIQPEEFLAAVDEMQVADEEV